MERRDFLKCLGSAAALGTADALLAAEKPAAPDAPKRSPLPTRTLGKTGVRVSRMALGGVAGMQRPPSRDFDPPALAEAALDLGITYFDTAPAYSNGQSESNYGEVIARRRKEVFLATKTGERTYDGAMRSIEQSLKRLRTDHVDLLQIHGTNRTEDLAAWGKPGGVLTALNKLRDQKVTRLIGVTGHESADVMRRAIEMYEFDTVLTTFNPTARRRPFRDAVLPLAVEKKMGILAMKIMGGGFGSLATGNPPKNTGTWYHDETPKQADAKMLIRYALGLPVSVAVVGMASVEQLRANVAAVRDFAPLDAAERERLEKAMA
jgi:aryl-alcohol dehydrogenase-like predicted oxidoreductase